MVWILRESISIKQVLLKLYFLNLNLSPLFFFLPIVFDDDLLLLGIVAIDNFRRPQLRPRLLEVLDLAPSQGAAVAVIL